MFALFGWWQNLTFEDIEPIYSYSYHLKQDLSSIALLFVVIFNIFCYLIYLQLYLTYFAI